MGVVYRARDTKLGRDVALKVLPPLSAGDPVRLQRFEQEAQAASALNHPNLLVVYDAGQHDGTPFLVSELLEGHTLRERIDEGPLPPRKAIELAVQIASGLSAVHEKGIVHRDLKPENLFLTRDGRVKILDFGVARALENGPKTSNTLPLTQSGAVMGTAGYMSPEQVRGRPADARSDLFALGAVLYEMPTGSMAFPGETPVDRGYAILNRDPPPFEDAGVTVPPALDRVVRRCLEKEPEQRIQHARDLAFALEAITDGSGKTSALAAQPVTGRFLRLAALGLGAAALLAVGALLGRADANAVAVPPPPLPPRPPGAERPPAQPTITRVTFRNGAILNARFSAGDKGLVYSGLFEGDAPQVVTGLLGSAQTRPVTSDWTTLLAASPTDELAIAVIDRKKNTDSNGVVLSRMSLAGGAPRQLLDHVICADFSADGQTLAVVRTTGRNWTLEHPPGHVVLESSEAIHSLRLSPGGDRLAFSRHPVPFDDRGRVEVVDLGGKVLARSQDYWTLEGLAWAAGGGEVWFTAAQHNLQRSIRALALDGKERDVFSTPGTLKLHDIDARGRALVGTSLTRMRIFGKVAGDAHERPLSWFDGSTPVDLSADGRTMLFIEGTGADSQDIETYLRVFDGTAPVRVSAGWGRALSPDGKRLAAVTPESQPLLIDVETGAVTPLSRLPTDYAPVQWTADGKALIVTHRRDDQRIAIDLARFELATGRLSPVGEVAPVDTVGMLGIKGGVITPDTKHYVYAVTQKLDELYVVEGLRQTSPRAEHVDRGLQLVERRPAPRALPVSGARRGRAAVALGPLRALGRRRGAPRPGGPPQRLARQRDRRARAAPGRGRSLDVQPAREVVEGAAPLGAGRHGLEERRAPQRGAHAARRAERRRRLRAGPHLLRLPRRAARRRRRRRERRAAAAPARPVHAAARAG